MLQLPDLPVAQRLIAIVDRFGRDNTPHIGSLKRELSRWASGEDSARYEREWQELAEHIVTRPHWLTMLFPDCQTGFPELLPLIQLLPNVTCIPDSRGVEARSCRAIWVAEQSDLANPESLMSSLLQELLVTSAGDGPHFLFLSRYYTFLDLLVARFVAPQLRPLHERIFATLHLQRAHWPHTYCSGYLYQGWEEVGLCGIKPTEMRLNSYEITNLLNPTDRVLDLGANNGFLALALGKTVAHVDAVELNPYLIDIGRTTAHYLNQRNVRFILADIESWAPDSPYDAVLSLANHSTIDHRMKMDFETYIARIFSTLKPGGWLFFESHNVFGPGIGGQGDDGDLDAKFEIVERYFEVVESHMHRAFVPAHDIDKLFVKLKRRDHYFPSATRRFSLESAKKSYFLPRTEDLT